MPQARYEVLIPKADNLGNPIRDLGKYCHDHLASQIKLEGAHIDSGRRVFWEGREEPFDAFLFVAEETPQVESNVKQLAVYVADVANQDVVLVTKHGKNGIETWPIKNPTYRHGEPADNSVLQ